MNTHRFFGAHTEAISFHQIIVPCARSLVAEMSCSYSQVKGKKSDEKEVLYSSNVVNQTPNSPVPASDNCVQCKIGLPWGATVSRPLFVENMQGTRK